MEKELAEGDEGVCCLVWFGIELEGLLYVFIWATNSIYSLSSVQLPYVKMLSLFFD